VRVEWTGSWDRDNERLKYEILRGPTVGSSTVLATYELDTNWWTLPPLGLLDTTAPPGTNQTYRVRVTDAFGNGGPSAAATIAVPSGAPATSAYRDSVGQNGAIHHWRLEEPTGTLARDYIRSNDLQLVNTTQRGVAGALLGENNAATTFPVASRTGTATCGRGATSSLPTFSWGSSRCTVSCSASRGWNATRSASPTPRSSAVRAAGGVAEQDGARGAQMPQAGEGLRESGVRDAPGVLVELAEEEEPSLSHDGFVQL
jgi:hypothetical protein